MNRNEMVWGAVYALAFIFKIGWVVLFLAPLCAFLWALTGAGYSKLYRRLLVPSIISVTACVILHSWIPMYSIPLNFAVLSLGYGIPDTSDTGSLLGALIYMISATHAELITRSVIVVLLILANLPTILT